ncbi:hypothetical protein O6H91_21G022400 [Diphasiastrum complanatum]|uniref:Uncharacterized protein n=3 Tax=Diphasiastrum complanatum TaxID=34168 RepID=A0ACC2AIM2_DIPCM|nr:hypothetical protein O6H91_21G022400 [Diphasiastrum complanatum]KAJ7517398.1 hypothetical protein O6H91_21G022400 [Diphasiastrum complanatum]KAJ7517399.1 hypothetical protein O6H91_21G022400 [Diphasiastrum complanatum]
MGMGDFLNSLLSRKTPFFGLRLWVIIGIGVGVFIVLILFFLSLWLASRRKSGKPSERLPPNGILPVSKEIKEVTPNDGVLLTIRDKSAETDSDKVTVHVGFGRKHQEQGGSRPTVAVETGSRADGPSSRPKPPTHNLCEDGSEDYIELASPQITPGSAFRSNNLLPNSRSVIGKHMAKDRGAKPFQTPDKGTHLSESSESGDASTSRMPQVSHLGWGHWYTLQDLTAATDGFSEANVLGEGGYGIVYKGQLDDSTLIAVKNLLNNRGQAEREFRVEVEAIGKVRHKNLVRLLGYCVEGNHRMLVYEYVDNGNLEQWLHGSGSPSHLVTWELRMKIALGTAKALAYLHEALEPKVVHRDVKASNILVDSQWNPKISDFGLAKLLGSEKSHVTTRVMGTFGYVAPEYVNTGLLTERSDVYSFGVLLMEIITGRDPVDYSRPPGEVNLVDWLKLMVGSRRSEEVADPRLELKPMSRALKRMLLIALRCVDPDASKRPKMGHVVHMLEAEEYPYQSERRAKKELNESKHLEVQNQENLIQRLPKEASSSRVQHPEDITNSGEVAVGKELKKQGPRYEG